MDKINRPLNIPGLERLLAALRAGEQLTISRADFGRCFGTNDAAHARLSHFAKGHGCDTDVLGSAVTFTKLR